MNCPNCQSSEIRKHGFYRGKQRYQCKTCSRQFVETHLAQNLQHQPSTGVEDRVHQYIRSVSTAPTNLLVNLQQDTADYPLATMQPTLEQVQLIGLWLQSIRASRVLEIGIFSGYSTLAMALAIADGGQLISCGVDGAHVSIARRYWQQAGVDTKIDLRIGSGLDLLDSLLATDAIASFDSIVICGLKHQYPLYYHRTIELLRPQGLLFATDVLWQGRVLNLAGYDDEFTSGIDRFNHALATDERFMVSVLPIGDGISIGIKL
jgi:predicted O-methyltransferase YrrM